MMSERFIGQSIAIICSTALICTQSWPAVIGILILIAIIGEAWDRC